jgi:hypothetical protein
MAYLVAAGSPRDEIGRAVASVNFGVGIILSRVLHSKIWMLAYAYADFGAYRDLSQFDIGSRRA